MSKRSLDDLDIDRTDELPILLETVGIDDEPDELLAIPRHEDTAEHPEYSAQNGAAEQALSSPEPFGPPAHQIAELEAQIGALTSSVRVLEQEVADRDRRLGELNGAFASLRRSMAEAAAADEGVAAQLAGRDAQLAELTATLERVEREATARSTELQRARSAADAAQQEADTLRAQLAARSAADAALAQIEELRERYATLAAYVEGRRRSWDEQQAANAQLAARVAALEQELKAGAKRVTEANAFAARESSRAVDLRAKLVDYARRVDALERELKLARSDPPARQPAPHEPETVPAAPAPAADAARHAAAAAAQEAPPVATDSVDAAAPAVEALAQLEAEVEYKRQQVAAQLVELREREQRLRTATTELGAVRAELDDSRSSIARLERTLIDKDRALEARDARIATLHEELQQRLARRDNPSGIDFLLPAPDAADSEPYTEPEPRGGAADTATPALICLTGDAPRRFALAKKIVTVGRGPQCDLQILTHFVSREHARLTSNGGATLIEDLGSRNGVFVNSVRVERRHLQQGDLVTIGETQFRFVESMAH
jgi:hypothetical protein